MDRVEYPAAKLSNPSFIFSMILNFSSKIVKFSTLTEISTIFRCCPIGLNFSSGEISHYCAVLTPPNHHKSWGIVTWIFFSGEIFTILGRVCFVSFLVVYLFYCNIHDSCVFLSAAKFLIVMLVIDIDCSGEICQNRSLLCRFYTGNCI